MKQHPLPLPPSADELQLDPYTPIRYCANCGKVVAANESVASNTHDFCTHACRSVYYNTEHLHDRPHMQDLRKEMADKLFKRP